MRQASLACRTQIAFTSQLHICKSASTTSRKRDTAQTSMPNARRGASNSKVERLHEAQQCFIQRFSMHASKVLLCTHMHGTSARAGILESVRVGSQAQGIESTVSWECSIQILWWLGVWEPEAPGCCDGHQSGACRAGMGRPARGEGRCGSHKGFGHLCKRSHDVRIVVEYALLWQPHSLLCAQMLQFAGIRISRRYALAGVTGRVIFLL